MAIEQGYEFDDVYIVPRLSPLRHRAHCYVGSLDLAVPILSAAMDTVTGIDMVRDLGEAGGLAIVPRFRPLEERLADVRFAKARGLPVAAAVGVDEPIVNAQALAFEGAGTLVVDVAHAGLAKALDRVWKLCNPTLSRTYQVYAGAVATADVAEALCQTGVDALCVGVGSGFVCRTRDVTGVGVPQLSALLACREVAERYDVSVLSDGGVESTGDFCKAMAVADGVIMGKVLCGTTAGAGDIGQYGYRRYRGMSLANPNLAPEGVEDWVEVTGDVSSVVERYSAALRSAMSYVGATNIAGYHANADFILRGRR